MANIGYLQVSRVCNQKCRFCSNPENERMIALDEAQRLVDDFVERGYSGVILTGGEPTLYPELAEVVAYAAAKGIPPRLVTNGQKTSDSGYFRSLVGAGLNHIHLSVQTTDRELQGRLTGKPDSLDHIWVTLDLAQELDVNVDINTTLNHYNADHLDRTVRELTARHPWLHHFVWNNLDPTTNRVADNPDVIAQLWETEVSLVKAVRYLQATGRTFRVERMPLCFMPGFEFASTETRKIVKGEERIVHFLDDKGMVQQRLWRHGKAAVCAHCRLDEICAGLFEMDRFYDSRALHPVFADPAAIAATIREVP
jgi:MoaA/NifB/PqqE/SkfB family radical SAM enzyme